MIITRDEFESWKDHPVTKLIVDAYIERQAEYTELLVQNNKHGNYSDDFYKGAILALRDVLNVDLEDSIDA